MSYQALYRVWRPQRFEDIAGQEAVTRTLKNALQQHKTSHAYLFTGPRGTGKTSAAKIFAKAINCPNQKDGEPCNECEICRAATEGRLNDVIEIDAASNNGVEEIRDIRDKARYAPTQAAYKIYIIDEVHMLSTGAFNALLKTLEEPPENVIFILATTEPHKIPLTIISRTQRFDFKRITYKDILDRMQYILGEENIPYEEEALRVIARAAHGGMRDALSLLDQVISYDAGKVTFQHAIKVSGSLTEEMMIAFSRSLLEQNAEEALLKLHEILAEGKEAGRFLEEMILFARDVLVYKQTGGKETDEEPVSESFRSFAGDADSAFLYRLVEEFSRTQQEMRFSTQPDVYLEVLAVKLSRPDVQAEAVPVKAAGAKPEEVARLEKQLVLMQQELQEMRKLMKNGPIAAAEEKESQPAAAVRSGNGGAARMNGGAFRPNFAMANQVMREAQKSELAQLQENWGDILDCLSVTQRAVLRAAKPVAASKTACILSFDYEVLCQKATEDAGLQEALDQAMQRIVGRSAQIVCMTAEQWNTTRREFVQAWKSGKLADAAPEAPENQKNVASAEPPAPAASPVQEERRQASPDLPPEPPAETEGYGYPDVPPEWELAADPLDDEEQRQQEAVEQAISLFGESLVKVIDE